MQPLGGFTELGISPFKIILFLVLLRFGFANKDKELEVCSALSEFGDVFVYNVGF